ncbi:MAG TPA: glutamine-hydrolyzing carbamoyl-phosphate synthase small subunit [Firmicutes bacterium]|nr:glutamine-hydrolyzing carbamoyl-phosphate synthase small subunit [Bacillota bacterium]
MNGYNRKLVLPTGDEFCGYGFGDGAERVTEVVFNTSMAGYQEIISDLSYTGQTVVMTYPIIGNYGLADGDYETRRPAIDGLIVREYTREPSNFRGREPLEAAMLRHGIAGICGVDTRRLTRAIRDHGSSKALITDIGTPVEAALERLEAAELPHDQVRRVSCREPWTAGGENAPLRAVLLDCGVKLSIVASLADCGCRVTVMPYDTPAGEIAALAPDGLLVSNGPGDPTDVPEAAETIRALMGRMPIFGICLGNQLLALASGARTYKLKFGHRGGNHPVMELATGKIAMTAQNHSYAVDEDTLAGTGLAVTHRNLLDNTVEGVANASERAFGVQFHPESAPGPHDGAGIFRRFAAMMKEGQGRA